MMSGTSNVEMKFAHGGTVTSTDPTAFTRPAYAEMVELTICGMYLRSIDALPPALRALRLVGCTFEWGADLELPETLTHLSIRGGSMGTPLPALPSGLVLLAVNFLDSSCAPVALPDPLPPALSVLEVNECGLRRLPRLPRTLTELSVSYNPGLVLPEELPHRLEVLACYRCDLAELPPLPETLVKLECNNNNIRYIPAFPRTLKEITVSDNPIETLPELPLRLRYLECASCRLTELPAGFTKCRDLEDVVVGDVPMTPEQQEFLKEVSMW